MESNSLHILENWNDVIAVNKPPGWLTIPGRGNKDDVPVVSTLLGEQLRDGAKRSKNPDLFIVHRLDQGTSGVIIFARSPEAHRELSLLFESREVKKVYWALVKGTPISQTINAPLFKLPSKRNKSVVDPKGKESVTEITVLKSAGDLSLIEARPLTGRSHQIRVHLSHIGCPLIGDRLYGGPENLNGVSFNDPLLHSHSIEFEWPKGVKRRAEAPLPPLFLNAIKVF